MAALPAIPLLSGAAFGLLVPDPPYIVVAVALTASASAAVWSWIAIRDRVLGAAVAAAFFAGGILLASVSWQRAWRPPLRIAFEELARGERVEAARAGRRLPEEPGAFAIVEGILRADASARATGVSLSISVDRIESADSRAIHKAGPAGSEKELATGTGGILVTVVGGLAADRLDEWRAGRRVRVPVHLQRPARYLDPGVPDFERALARRGTTLVGSVKSGALVEVLAGGGWWSETLGAIRAFARRARASRPAGTLR